MFPTIRCGCILVVIAVALRWWLQDTEFENIVDTIPIWNNATFFNITNNSSLSLVLFYANSSDKSNRFLPMFAKMGIQLQKEVSNLTVGRVNIDTDFFLYQHYELPGIPIILLFKGRDDLYFDYTGLREENDMTSWIRRKLSPPAKQLNTTHNVELFIESDNVTVLGLFKDIHSNASINYLSAAEYIDNISFGISNATDVLENMTTNQDTIIIFKKFDEPKLQYVGNMSVYNIGIFILSHSTPLVQRFSWLLLNKYTSAENLMNILLFVNPNEPKFNEYLENMRIVAAEFRKNVTFMFVNLTNEDDRRLLIPFNLTEKDCPALRGIDLTATHATSGSRKYVPDINEPNDKTLDLSVSAIKRFTNNILNGNLRPIFFSQEIPDDWNETSIKKVVGKNFKSVVKDSDKHAVVLFTAPWCMQCDVMLTFIERISKEYQDELLFATTDFTQNEFKEIQKHEFPGIKLFPKNSDLEIDFTAQVKSYENIMLFLKPYITLKDKVNQDIEAPKDEL